MSAVLHKTLGETAVVKITSFRKEERTGAVKRFYASYAVTFVPSSTASRKVDLSAPCAQIVFPNEPSGGKFDNASLFLDGFSAGEEYYRIISKSNPSSFIQRRVPLVRNQTA